MKTLPYDISRCKGFENNPLCQMCRRREQGSKYRQSYLVIEKEPEQRCELQIKKTEASMSEQCIDEYKELYAAVRQMQRYAGADKQKHSEAQSNVYEIAYAIQLKLEREEDDDE